MNSEIPPHPSPLPNGEGTRFLAPFSLGSRPQVVRSRVGDEGNSLTTMTVWAVLNQLGIACLPQWFPHHWLGRWFMGTADHSIHHLKYTVHYGLYLTFWDKLFGTQDANYEKKFDER